MGGKRDKRIEGQDWYPSYVGEVFIVVMPNGTELLQMIKHFEDGTHWGSGELPLNETAGIDTTNLPRWKCVRGTT